MTDFALAIHIGPLGSFISAGRRSRDLWWGSTWLAECTANVALELHELGQARDEKGNLVHEVELVLPSHGRLTALRDRKPLPGGANRDFEKRVSNHIRAKLTARPTALIPALLEKLEARAHEWVRKQAADALSNAGGRVRLDLVLNEDRFKEQLEAIANGDFVHFSAAWAPVVGGDLSAALRRADELAAAARRTRTFSPAMSSAGARKSDLDAGRDGVLKAPSDLGPQDRAKARVARAVLGIGESEQLDALGFARRIAAFSGREGPELGRLPFPPISRIAIDPWLERPKVGTDARRMIGDLKSILIRSLQGPPASDKQRNAFLMWCTPARDPTDRPKPNLEDHFFPFDASILFEDGLAAARERVKRLDSRDDEQRLALKTIDEIERAEIIPKLHRALGVPSPYYALIEADGDGVGTALENAEPARYGDLVKNLDRYADLLDTRIRPLGARAFYVGGDDALVLAPLAKLTEVMRTMASHFSDSMKSPEFTLTFGVIVAHLKDDLRWVRRQASEAIQSAKRRRAAQKRNHEASPSETAEKWTPVGWAEIREKPRSGSMRKCTGEVTALTCSLDALVADVASGKLSQRSPQLMLELGALVDFGPPNNTTSAEDDQQKELLRRAAVELAVERVRAQMKRSSDQRTLASTATSTAIDDLARDATSWSEVEDIASRLRLAARLATTLGVR